MRNSITAFFAGILLLIGSVPSSAQSNIVLEDYDYWIKPGGKVETSVKNTSTPVDIGSTNATSWDFSGLSAEGSYTSTLVKPNTTPYRPDYPKSDITFDYIENGTGNHILEYYCYSSYFIHLHGSVIAPASAPGHVTKYLYNPIKIFVYFPMAFNSTWKDTVTETVKVMDDTNVVSSENFKIITTANVNGYGQLTFPGGKTVDAFRARIHQIRTNGITSEEKLIFQWFTKTGETFIIETNPSSPGTGVINADKIKWMINEVTTDVNDKPSLMPDKFALQQNYPNPFNPSTSVTYSVAAESNVEIKVFSTIGKEVATLVNERMSPGTYSISFNGKGLTSGIYFLKMSAGNFNKVIKMTMVK